MQSKDTYRDHAEHCVVANVNGTVQGCVCDRNNVIEATFGDDVDAAIQDLEVLATPPLKARRVQIAEILRNQRDEIKQLQAKNRVYESFIVENCGAEAIRQAKEWLKQ